MVSSRGELFRRNWADETISGKTQRTQSDASTAQRPEYHRWLWPIRIFISGAKRRFLIFPWWKSPRTPKR
jgi:hypothetical protein